MQEEINIAIQHIFGKCTDFLKDGLSRVYREYSKEHHPDANKNGFGHLSVFNGWLQGKTINEDICKEIENVIKKSLVKPCVRIEGNTLRILREYEHWSDYELKMRLEKQNVELATKMQNWQLKMRS